MKGRCFLMAVDPHFGVDMYERPKVLSESQTVVYNILTILFGKPGFYPSIPTLGMYIQQYLYNFQDEINTELLKAELIAQCKDFNVAIYDGTFDVSVTTINNDPLLIFQLPTIITNAPSELVLGVTVNNTGDYRFNFVFNKVQYL